MKTNARAIFVIAAVAALWLVLSGCKRSTVQYQPARLRAVVLGSLPDGGVTALWPVPVRRGDALTGVVFISQCDFGPVEPVGPVRAKRVAQPHELVELDAATGEILRRVEVSPVELDRDWPDEPLPPGDPLPPERPATMDQRSRLETIAPRVWWLYARDEKNLATADRALVREYRQLVRDEEGSELTLFYERVGADFERWARAAGAP